jgi:hypothetical protein
VKKTKFLGINRQLIEKLRELGYAFNSIKSISDRKYTIAMLLDNNSILGSALSPVLKDNTFLRLDISLSTITIVKISENIETILHNFINIDNDTFITTIGEIYKDYFYTDVEVSDIINSFDITKHNRKLINTRLLSINHTIPLRHYIIFDNRIEFYLGASIFSIKVIFWKIKKSFSTYNLVYKKHSRKYTIFYGVKYSDNINSKFYSIIYRIIYIDEFNDNTIPVFIKTYNDIKS